MARARKSASRTAARRQQARTVRARQARHGNDAVSVLRRQHEEAEKAFRDLSIATGEERRKLFQHLADMLAAHASVEERLVYPELLRVEELAAPTRDAREEHLVQRRLLTDMLERDLDAAVFDAKCRVLEAEVRRHVEEEEGGLLPRLEKTIGRERLDELGAEIDRAYADLMEHEPRREVQRETDPAPFLH